jgi:low temperature requirement protein LtrA
MPRPGGDTTASWDVPGAHMAEGCGLFVIICLGETLLVSGATFAGMEWGAAGLLAFLASSVTMWWVYFHVGHKRGTGQIKHSDDAGRIARLSFTYAHIPTVLAIVLAAVGPERAIAHPRDIATLGDVAVITGGIAPWLPLWLTGALAALILAVVALWEDLSQSAAARA